MQRKPTRQSRGPNAEEKAFQAWLKGQPCCVGGNGITEVHHCVGATYKHNKVHIGHWFCIALSKPIHSYFHNEKSSFICQFGSQRYLWELMVLDYASETGKKPPDDVYDAIMDSGK